MTSPLEPASLASTLIAVAQQAAYSVQPPGAAPVAAERGLGFLMAAYTIVWVILAVYLMSLSVRLRRLAQQVRRLKERIGG